MIESNLELKIKEIVGTAVGEASMQWIPRPTGVFDSSNASAIVDRVTCDILNLIAQVYTEHEVLVQHQKREIERLQILPMKLEAENRNLKEEMEAYRKTLEDIEARKGSITVGLDPGSSLCLSILASEVLERFPK